MHPWWTEQQAGMIGAIGGSLFGLFGGVLGTVAGLCAPLRSACFKVAPVKLLRPISANTITAWFRSA